MRAASASEAVGNGSAGAWTSSVLHYTVHSLPLHGGGSRNLLGQVVLLRLLCCLDGQVLVERAVILTRQFLEGTALGLRDQPGCENTAEHEAAEYLHDMVEPGRGAGVWLGTLVHQGSKDALCDDGTDFARCSADTVGCRAVARREALARHDEGGCVGSKVEEELRQNVQRK